ncbi:hypothetical protein [Elizabethkingia anophelis]|uniref:hypothetical protein n=1 Tax=Elizabethkingia anophelis TaxID=1117645 RepID=UPI00246832CB|nr:hypothetical protein [Elizabethkingia anophelis]WGL71013.1 hypothetical protein QFB79_06565 [Elizabethkingia anophelis]
MYKLVLSYDIQNEKGESILKDYIPNTASYPLSEEDVKDFSSLLAQDRLSIFLTHFLATGFLVEGSLRKRRGIIPEVKECNYKISMPLKPIAIQFYHSKTMVHERISHDSQRVYPYESVVNL